MPATSPTQLSYDVFVSDGPPRAGEEQMMELYPDRLNPGPVWYGALGLLGK